MTDIADRYISKSGRTESYNRAGYIDDLCTASSFLVWAEDEFLPVTLARKHFRHSVDCLT